MFSAVKPKFIRAGVIQQERRQIEDISGVRIPDELWSSLMSCAICRAGLLIRLKFTTSEPEDAAIETVALLHKILQPLLPWACDPSALQSLDAECLLIANLDSCERSDALQAALFDRLVTKKREETPYFLIAVCSGSLPLELAERLMLQLELKAPLEQFDRRFDSGLVDRRTLYDENRMIELVATVQDHMHMTTDVQQYLRDIIIGVRNHQNVLRGASPQASLAMHAAAKVDALLAGRTYVTPNNVIRVAPRVLCHRIVIDPASSMNAEQVVTDVLARIPAPL